MNTKHSALAVVACLVWSGWSAPAAAGDATVECISHNYQYNECYAPLESPQLVYQSSHAACIVNRTWGFNSRTSRIWVSEGCSGVFADPGGYHHGQAGTYDRGARAYGARGHDTGAIVAGAVLGALLEGAAESGKKSKPYTTSNRYRKPSSGYTGCHGVGCLVDDPGDDSRSDDPPEPGRTKFFDSSRSDDPPEPGQTEFSDSSRSDDPPEPGQTEFSDSSGSDDPPEPGQTEFSDDD